MTPLTESYQKLKNATIMIVDDEPMNTEVVQIFLEEEGYRHFVTVEDSTQVMKLLEETRPDLMLLDLVMPSMSGFDVLSEVRTNPKFKHLPVIILTASTDSESKLKALDLGATDFLAKPLDQSELSLRVRNTLGAKAYQDQLAYYDPLTKLPNRQLFLEDLSWALQGAKRHNEQLALLSIEIDGFEKVNDTIGLRAGDEVLRLVTHRIKEIIRKVDILSRSGEEKDNGFRLFHLDSGVFSLLLDRIHNAESSATVAERILGAIKAPMHIEGREIYLSASIGIAAFPEANVDSEGLLRLAASAKDYAKKLGGDACQFANRAINEMYEKRLRLETKLRKALARKEFALYYQPKVDVKQGVIRGVEALLRWKSDEGVVSPSDFIPLAEETGLIVPIGEWVLQEACRKLKEWHQETKAPIGMSVNLSVKQFTDPEFIATVKRIVGSSGVDPNFLTLELTESLLLDDIDEKIELLKNLKELGLKLSIDDFGTGYSSLSYLRKLPVDELKIDRAFIMDVATHADSSAITSSIIFLAQSLSLLTVAEGVEKEEELQFLQNLNCHQYQGFFFSRPVPGDELLELLRKLND